MGIRATALRRRHKRSSKQEVCTVYRLLKRKGNSLKGFLKPKQLLVHPRDLHLLPGAQETSSSQIHREQTSPTDTPPLMPSPSGIRGTGEWTRQGHVGPQGSLYTCILKSWFSSALISFPFPCICIAISFISC